MYNIYKRIWWKSKWEIDLKKERKRRREKGNGPLALALVFEHSTLSSTIHFTLIRRKRKIDGGVQKKR